MRMGTSFTKDLSSGRCLVIGEVAMAHDGSLGLAIASSTRSPRGGRCGQVPDPSCRCEGTTSEPFRVSFSPQDPTRRDY